MDVQAIFRENFSPLALRGCIKKSSEKPFFMFEEDATCTELESLLSKFQEVF